MPQFLRVLLCSLSILSFSHAATEAPPKLAEQNIYKHSDILFHDGSHTILPKHCVLSIPFHLRSRVVHSPNGIFLMWPNFYAQNASWIHTEEVTLANASGLQPFTNEQLVRFSKSGKVVVAVHNNSPISIRRTQVNNK